MARTRSPNYPSVPLGEALAYVGQIFGKDHRHWIPREVAAQHMGFKRLHGSSLTALSSLIKFGLLDVQQGQVKVSDLGLDLIVEQKGSEIWSKGLRRAASNPALFSAIRTEFGGMPPSDETLRAYLIRKGFNPSAVGDAIRAYRETFELVEKECGAYSADATEPEQSGSVGGAEDGDGARRKPDIGDFIQWESQGVWQLPKPRRVAGFSDDGRWLYVEGSNMRIRVSETHVVDQPSPAGQTEREHDNRGPLRLGTIEATLPLDEGLVVLQWPRELSAESYEDLQSWVELVLRRAKRSVRSN